MTARSSRLGRAIVMAKPLYLLAGAVLFGLGTAVARYVGVPTDGRLVGLGLLTVVAGQFSLHFLAAFLTARLAVAPGNDGRPPATLLLHDATRLPLAAALVGLAIWGTSLSLAVQQGSFPPLAWVILILGFAVGLAWVLPSLKLASSGYGEVALSTAVAGLVPAFGFSLQGGSLDALLLMSVVPLIALHFAMLIVLELPEYARDLRLAKGNLLVRLGWAPAMRAHDLAVLLAAGVMAYASFQGLPYRVALGTLLALPLAVAQVWQMERLRRGFPARWRTITTVAMGTFGLTLYLELAGYLLTMA